MDQWPRTVEEWQVRWGSSGQQFERVLAMAMKDARMKAAENMCRDHISQNSSEIQADAQANQSNGGAADDAALVAMEWVLNADSTEALEAALAVARSRAAQLPALASLTLTARERLQKQAEKRAAQEIAQSALASLQAAEGGGDVKGLQSAIAIAESYSGMLPALDRQLENARRHLHTLNATAKLSSAFACPITHELMRDPVVTADGMTYERTAIERWLIQHDTSPLTGTRLPHTQVIPNVLMRSVIIAHADLLAGSGAVEGEVGEVR